MLICLINDNHYILICIYFISYYYQFMGKNTFFQEKIFCFMIGSLNKCLFNAYVFHVTYYDHKLKYRKYKYWYKLIKYLQKVNIKLLASMHVMYTYLMSLFQYLILDYYRYSYFGWYYDLKLPNYFRNFYIIL